MTTTPQPPDIAGPRTGDVAGRRQALDELGRSSVTLFNDADWEELAARTAEGYVYDEIGTGARVEGVHEALAYYQTWRTAFPDVTGEIEAVAVDVEASTVVVQTLWRGTHDGPLPMPDGSELPASGRAIELRSCIWLTASPDGRIAAERHYLDIAAMLAQLGVLDG